MKDLHIHMSGGRKDSPKEFKEKCLAAGVDGGAVFSLCPQMIRPEPGEDQRWQSFSSGKHTVAAVLHGGNGTARAVSFGDSL